MYSRNEIINTFSALGEILSRMGSSARGRQVVDRACAGNGWFLPGDIFMAAGALAGCILDRETLALWASRYRYTGNPRNVAVIMAGNMPFAGLFDMLCVLAAGHKCLVKYSSKDKVAMEFVTARLREILPGLPVREFGGTGADAVIASGSDNTVRHLKAMFGDIPALYRGTMTSVAILDGNERVEDLEGLATDIFSYNGLGCRNVSRLLLPEGYDIRALVDLARDRELNPKFGNNYRQRSSMLSLSGVPFTDCGNWILREDDGFPAYLSEITYGFYNDRADAARWVREHARELQCVVAGESWTRELPFGCVPFGRAQYPGPGDYPDRVDVMEFLENL